MNSCFYGRGKYLIAFVDELMGSSDELEAVHVVELCSYLISE